MILIADSGSTKTCWLFTDGTLQNSFTTGGANPFFRSTGDMIGEWIDSPVNQLRGNASHVYFYAAGVINNEKAGVIKRALTEFFPGAEIRVESDLLAAAHATLGNKSGIACILGTGSNSCLYDGSRITAQVPPLGFILGDEGSGAVLGRQLVGDYLKKTMPQELHDRFKQSYPIGYGEFMDRVYRHGQPNMFLAGFVPFLKNNIDHRYCADLVYDAFDRFIMRNVAQYAGYTTLPVNFAGSVAFHFQEQLKAVLSKRSLTLGKIVKEPLLNLMHHHLQKH